VISFCGGFCNNRGWNDDAKDSFDEKIGQVFLQVSKYHVKVLFGKFKVKLVGEDIFKSTIGN